MPLLSTNRASYTAKSSFWLPSWYRLYSVLPGYKSATCQSVPVQYSKSQNRIFTINNCSDANAAQVSNYGRQLRLTLKRVETRFDHAIYVSQASFILIPPNIKYLKRDSQLLRRHDLHFNIAVRFDSKAPNDSIVDATSSTAHELYHMAIRALQNSTKRNDVAFPEEVRASLFGSCIEMDIFKKIKIDALPNNILSDPNVVEEQPSLHASVAGNLRATQILYEIAGQDHKITSPPEIARFNHLCESLTDGFSTKP